jgi:EAL domain-containing protein (putative c-di-GMP-specific phosphodiesterase class I)
MQQADFAMLWAKARRAGIRVFDATLEHELKYDLRREAEIREAIPLGQFIPFYQPLVDLDTGRTIGWEVLMRWDHPTRGIVAPAEFIDVAEATGLIDEMFWPMLTTACRATRVHTDGSFIAVNVTLRQIMDVRFAARLSDVLKQTDFAPQRLEIEITEREHVHEIDRLAAGLQALGALGVRIALDDFGTGSANLTLLSALPIHKLKIDRSFISNIEHDEQNRRIVTSIVGLARSMDLICTAEGIESEAVAQRLRDLGCHQGQGYFFGRPSLHHDLRADGKLAAEPNRSLRAAVG